MRYSFFRSIRANLILLVLLSVLPALGAIIYTGLDNNRRTIKEAENNTLRVLADLAYDYELTVQQARLFLSMLARLPDIQNQNAAACNKILGELIKQNPLYVKLFVSTADGTVYASNEPFSPHTIEHRKYYQDIIKTRAFSVGEYEAGGPAQRPVIHFAYPVLDTKQRLRGVVALALDLKRYGEIFIKKDLPEDSAFAIYDHHHIYLYRYPDPGIYIGKKDRPDMIKRMLTGPDEEAITAIGVEGIPRLGAYKKLYLQGSSTPYHFMRIGISAEKALASARKTFLINIVILCSALFAALILALVFGDIFVARRLNRLVIASNRLGGGDLTARTGLRRQDEGEMGRLAHAFDGMADALERKEAQRKRAEEELRIFMESVDNSSDAVGMSTPEGKHYYQNRAFDELFGPVGENPPESVYVDPAVGREVFRAIMEGGQWTGEAQMYAKDRSILDILLRAYANKDKSGCITALVGIHMDITERKEAETRLRNTYEQLRAADEQMRAQYDSLVESERSLRESEEKYRRLTETAHDVIVSVDLNWKITYVNQATLNMAGGMNPVGMSLLNFTPPHMHELQEAMMQKRREGFRDVLSFEWEINPPTGKKAIFEIRAALLTEDDKPTGVLFVARDITERKRVEEELRRLSIAVEQAAEDIIITDPEGVIQYVNPAFEKITGYSRVEVIGKTPRVLKSGVHDAAFYEHLWKTIKRGEIWTGRITNRRKDGILIAEDATICPLLTSAGMLTGYVALKRDVTEAVQLEAQFRQSQKMEAVGQLAGGVAHDFNNILQAILGYTDIVLFSLGPDDKNRAKLMEVYKAGQRAAALTQQLLAFSRRQVLQLAPLDLNQAIEDVMKMLRHVIGENIELHITPCRDLLTVSADRGQIEQVVMNLCLNARDAMPEGGRLSIETGNVLLDAHYCAQHEWAKPGWYVFLSITDSGCGMDEETRGKIFEPFFTTKEPDRGTGLGLSTVYGIARQHNGMIQVSSEPGKGSRFSVYLPAIERAETAIIPESNKQVPGGHETILLAEDNEQVRHLAAGILERSGYKVLTAVDGEEALLVYQDHGREIDLLLLDVVMPKKGGRNVYEEIRSVRSDVRCLFISGYSVNAVHTNFILDQGLHLIQKPFKNDDLLLAVRQTLDRS